MGSVPKFLELRSVPFFSQKLDLVPFPVPKSAPGTSSVPVPFPFTALNNSFRILSNPWRAFQVFGSFFSCFVLKLLDMGILYSTTL